MSIGSFGSANLVHTLHMGSPVVLVSPNDQEKITHDSDYCGILTFSTDGTVGDHWKNL
jgi:hypothetical protein